MIEVRLVRNGRKEFDDSQTKNDVLSVAAMLQALVNKMTGATQIASMDRMQDKAPENTTFILTRVGENGKNANVIFLVREETKDGEFEEVRVTTERGNSRV